MLPADLRLRLREWYDPEGHATTSLAAQAGPGREWSGMGRADRGRNSSRYQTWCLAEPLNKQTNQPGRLRHEHASNGFTFDSFMVQQSDGYKSRFFQTNHGYITWYIKKHKINICIHTTLSTSGTSVILVATDINEFIWDKLYSIWKLKANYCYKLHKPRMNCHGHRGVRQ